jgi:hypothetical protein
MPFRNLGDRRPLFHPMVLLLSVCGACAEVKSTGDRSQDQSQQAEETGRSGDTAQESGAPSPADADGDGFTANRSNRRQLARVDLWGLLVDPVATALDGNTDPWTRRPAPCASPWNRLVRDW